MGDGNCGGSLLVRNGSSDRLGRGDRWHVNLLGRAGNRFLHWLLLLLLMTGRFDNGLGHRNINRLCLGHRLGFGLDNSGDDRNALATLNERAQLTGH